MSIEPSMPWWQKLLMVLKIWRPPHHTKHQDVKKMPRPEPPPVTGAYGNEVVYQQSRRVPQRKDATP